MRCAAPPAPAVAFDPLSAFALGSAGGTSCPSGTASVLIPADCKKAAAAAARPYGGAVRVGGLPAGCFWFTVGVGGFFVNDQVGQSNAYAQRVCAGAPDFSAWAMSILRTYLFLACVRLRSCVCVRARMCARLFVRIAVVLRAAAHGQSDPTRASNATHPPAMARTPAAR